MHFPYFSNKLKKKKIPCFFLDYKNNTRSVSNTWETRKTQRTHRHRKINSNTLNPCVHTWTWVHMHIYLTFKEQRKQIMKAFLCQYVAVIRLTCKSYLAFHSLFYFCAPHHFLVVISTVSDFSSIIKNS